MRTPAFWHAQRPSALARMLQPFGALYGAFVARRMRQQGARPGAPAIVVGNFVAGGAGKTPAALEIARLLEARGERIAFVSRGYGGAAGDGPLRVDGQGASEVGDEALLLARAAPTFIGADRAAAAALAVAGAGPSALILDDGLQSRQVEPDLAVAVGHLLAFRRLQRDLVDGVEAHVARPAADEHDLVVLVGVAAQEHQVHRPVRPRQLAAVGDREVQQAHIEVLEQGRVGHEHAEVAEAEAGSAHGFPLHGLG